MTKTIIKLEDGDNIEVKIGQKEKGVIISDLSDMNVFLSNLKNLDATEALKDLKPIEISMDLNLELRLFLSRNELIEIEQNFNDDKNCEECVIYNDGLEIAREYGSMSIIAMGKALEIVESKILSREILTSKPMTKEEKTFFDKLSSNIMQVGHSSVSAFHARG